jgi:hypothetical protein
MSLWLRWGVTLGLVASLSGCALDPSSGRRSSGGFPTPSELEGLGAAAEAEELFSRDVADVPTWEAAGPFPSELAVVPRQDGGSPWDAVLEAVAARRLGLVVLTEGMHCTARELGRFHLARRAHPAESLRRFIASRCGSTATRLQASFLHAEVSDSLSDDELFLQWERQVQELVRRSLSGRGRTAGIWFGRSNGVAVVALAWAERRVYTEPISIVPQGAGRVVLRGEILDPAESVGASFTRGRFGVEDCTLNPEAVLPSFEFTCEVDPADEFAWIQVFIHRADRILGEAVMEALVWPGGEPISRYDRVDYAAPTPAHDDDEFVDVAAGLINAVRADAGMGPLELEDAQSAQAAELAPAYFQSWMGKASPLVADTVALGMMAGWEVDGLVQHGRFTSSTVLRTDDVSRWVSRSLQYPGPRRTLLDPAASKLALGSIVAPDAQGFAAIAATYVVFEEGKQSEDADLVFERIATARAERERSGTVRIEELDAAAVRISYSIASGGASAEDALNELLEQTQSFTGRSVRGWLLQVSSLEEVPFPPEVLDPDSVELAIAVARAKSEGQPWAQYVVLIAMPASRGQMM